MAEIKDKHPSWFKMKIERRKLIKDLPTDTAVNVLLACWDYLETMEIPGNLSPMERIAFSAFFPDMEEAWARYEQRINAKQKGKSTDTVRSRPTPNETETEAEPEIEEDTKRVYKEDKSPRSRFVLPSLEEVKAYCIERNNGIDPSAFVDFYTANGWKQARGKSIVDWRAAVRTWERRQSPAQPKEEDPYADVI